MKAGAQLTYVVPTGWPEAGDASIDEPAFRVVEVPVIRPGDVNRHRLADPGALVDLVRETGAELVDLAEEPFSAVVHQMLSRLPGDLPVVAYAAQNLDKRWPPPFHQWERQAFSRLHGIYPCSRQAASVQRGKGFGGLLTPLPLGWSPERFRPGEQSIDDDEITLALFGRLEMYKGVLDAVTVLAELARHRPARLLLVGGGPAAEPAMAMAADLGVANRVEVIPWLSEEALAAAYRKAHVVLVPSTSTPTWVEQFGRTIVEGQASGCVVAAYASGSIPEVVAEAGLLVAEGDSAALAQAVSSLVADPAQWDRLRRAGVERSSGMTWDEVAQRQMAFYRQAAERGPGPVVGGSPAARRRAAAEEFGPPATAGGQQRPFADPLLRARPRAGRIIGAAMDAVAEAIHR